MGNKTELWDIYIQICIYDKLYINTMICDIHLNDEELCNLYLLIYDEELSNPYLIYDGEFSILFLLIYDKELSNLYLLIYFILGTTIKDDTEVDLAIIIGASVGGCVALLIIIIIICCHCLRIR